MQSPGRISHRYRRASFSKRVIKLGLILSLFFCLSLSLSLSYRPLPGWRHGRGLGWSGRPRQTCGGGEPNGFLGDFLGRDLPFRLRWRE